MPGPARKTLGADKPGVIEADDGYRIGDLRTNLARQRGKALPVS